MLTPLDQHWQPRVREYRLNSTRQALRTPMMWLCQNLRNQVLFAQHQSLKRTPVLVSLGDAFLRPSYKSRFFTANLKQTLGLCGPLMVDSGGFALMRRRHLRWSMREIERLYEHLPADILVALDHPPSPNDDRITRERLRKKTIYNLKRMSDFVPANQLMPVVHGHSLGEIERSCDGIGDICPKVNSIGIGGLVPLICSGGLVRQFRYVRKDGSTGDRSTWVSDALQLVRERFPDALLHAFGIGSATTAISVLALGADSVDSFSWRRVANYGAIFLPGCSERFPTIREGRSCSRPVVSKQEVAILMKCECPICTETRNTRERLKSLEMCYQNRAVHNAWTVLSEVANLRNAIQQNRMAAFLRSRLSPRHRFYKAIFERWPAFSQ
jgi:7-cyano-7-deazaguanine tRNA-ribosyltransferase